MSWLTALLQAAPDDPLIAAGLLVAMWLPICAVGLLVLWSLAQTQEIFGHRRRPRPGIMLPPPEVRPLAMRRIAAPPESRGSGSGGVVGLARVSLAVGVVAGLTFVALSANGPLLLAALNR
jgi:hypothetical protein